MLQLSTADLEKAPLKQDTIALSTIVETTDQLLVHSNPLNTGALSNLLQQRLCTACKLPFIHNHYSVSNPHRRGVTCLGCNKLFSFISKDDMCQKLKNIDNGDVDSIGDEERHINDYHLHRLRASDLYHLPLSCRYYAKQFNKDDKEVYAYDSTDAAEDTLEIYSRCYGCISFVKRKRKTLRTASKRALGGGVASFDSLMEFMVNSNATCALTGIKGSWSSFPGDPMYLLSLDHKIPLRAGGSSMIDNLQVSLQGFNNIKGDYEAEDFKRWFAAVKQIPKHGS